MRRSQSKGATPFRPRNPTRSELIELNLQLQAKVDKLVHENEELRSALSLYQEVLRRTTKTAAGNSGSSVG